MKLDWTAASTSVYTSLELNPSSVIINETEYSVINARALDQYGYGLSGYSVGSWTRSPSWVLSITSTTSMSATIRGDSEGNGTLTATLSGKSDNTSVTVECDPQDPGCLGDQ